MLIDRTGDCGNKQTGGTGGGRERENNRPNGKRVCEHERGNEIGGRGNDEWRRTGEEEEEEPHALHVFTLTSICSSGVFFLGGGLFT